MRPRPEGRGERGCGLLASRVALQCGHDPKAVENPSGGGERQRRTASMRPRPEGRGERRASDQPRGRRSFNAATTRRPWRTPCAHRLDWPARFNAATTRRPWRTDALRRRRSGVLQCGHDPKAVENDRDDRDLRGRQTASMRPRPEGRGERWSRSRPKSGATGLQCGHDPKAVENAEQLRGRSSRRFNAATTRRPWRTGRDRMHATVGMRASMRPRPEGRGERQR